MLTWIAAHTRRITVTIRVLGVPFRRPAHPDPAGRLRAACLAVTGRLADGWIPSFGFAPPDRIPAMRAPDRRGGGGRRA